jgi:hypothetical protein
LDSWLNCPRCSERYKSFLTSCPRCGYSNPVKHSSNKGSNTKKWAAIAGVSVVVVVAVFLVIGKFPVGGLNISISDSLVTSDQNPPQQIEQTQYTTSSNSKLDELKQYALQKINEDRAKFGLQPVQLSDNPAAQIHAGDMLITRKLSHWTSDGMKPYMKYSVNGGFHEVSQNAAMQWSEGSAPSNFRLDLCKANDFFCLTYEVEQAIDSFQYDMVYDDKECCNDGHRENILDKHHTHVSLGIAYNSFEIACIQNFENQYVSWFQPITLDEESNTISMSGTLTDGISLDVVNIFFDPLPTPATYEEHVDDTSYGLGDFAAIVVEPPPPDSYYVEPEDYVLIIADGWTADNQGFDITFPIAKMYEKYGSGVYTIVIYANDGSEDFAVTNTALFIENPTDQAENS